MSKIVIIGPAHPLRGGLASFDERLAKQFISEGHDTLIYTFSLQYPSFMFPGTTQYSSEPAPEGIPIKVCINSINPLNWLLIGRELRKLRPDFIVVRYWLPVMGPCLGSILRLAKGNSHTRVICIADNIIPHEKRKGDKQFTAYFMKPVDAFVTMSEKVMRDLRSLDKVKPALQVNHPLYDNFGAPVDILLARQHLHIDPAKKVLLFFGFIRKYKGLDLLLEAIYLLKKEQLLQHFTLLVAGEFYEEAQPYLDQVKNLDIADVTTLRTQFISDSEVKYFLCAADVVVQPYRNATQSGVTPLAYHFGIPMIVTNVGGLPSMVPDNVAGLVAEPNPAAIAASIHRYFNLGKTHFLRGLNEEKKKYLWHHLSAALTGLAATLRG